MVADVVDIDGLFLAVLDTGKDAADVGLAHGAGAQRGRVGQQGFEELDGNDLAALEHHRAGGQHAHIFQALHVGQVALAEGHKEADALDAGDVFGQRLDLLVVQQVHVLLAHLGEVVGAVDLHGLGLDPVAVLPVAAVGRDLAQVDLRVEVGGEGIAVVAAVAVQDVDGVDLVKIMLQRIGREHAGDAGIKAGTQDRGQAGVLELFAVGPLPAVIEVGGKALLLAAFFVDGTPGGVVGVLRLVVGGVDVVHAAGQAGVHDGQVLIGQGDVQHGVWLVAVDQGFQRLHVVGIHLGGGDLGGGLALQLFFQRVALGQGAAGDAQLGESSAVLAAFLDGHLGDAAAADNKQFAHGDTLLFGQVQSFIKTCGFKGRNGKKSGMQAVQLSSSSSSSSTYRGSIKAPRCRWVE